MTIQLTYEESERYKRYNLPNCTTSNRVKLNVININKHNSLKHETMKLELGYISSKFITEAERPAKVSEKVMFNSDKKIVDFVDLVTGKEYEIVHSREDDYQIQYYRHNGVIPVIVGDSFICKLCNQKYPRRNKGNICQVCKKRE